MFRRDSEVKSQDSQITEGVTHKTSNLLDWESFVNVVSDHVWFIYELIKVKSFMNNGWRYVVRDKILTPIPLCSICFWDRSISKVRVPSYLCFFTRYAVYPCWRCLPFPPPLSLPRVPNTMSLSLFDLDVKTPRWMEIPRHNPNVLFESTLNLPSPLHRPRYKTSNHIHDPREST